MRLSILHLFCLLFCVCRSGAQVTIEDKKSNYNIASIVVPPHKSVQITINFGTLSESIVFLSTSNKTNQELNTNNIPIDDQIPALINNIYSQQNKGFIHGKYSTPVNNTAKNILYKLVFKTKFVSGGAYPWAMEYITVILPHGKFIMDKNTISLPTNTYIIGAKEKKDTPYFTDVTAQLDLN